MASVRPRKWKTQDGVWHKGHQVSWYDENHERHRELYSGDGAKKKADDRKLELDVAKRDGKSTAGGTLAPGEIVTKVRDAGERWVRYVELELKRERSTWEAYETHLERHINPTLIERVDEKGAHTHVAFGDLGIHDVTPPDCEMLKDA